VTEVEVFHDISFFGLVDPRRIRRAIDIGCHRGEHIQRILKPMLPTAEILGVEPKTSNYQECLKLNIEGVSFLQLDCRDLSAERVGHFDLVWCCGLIYHLDDPTRLICAIRSISHGESYICVEGHFATEAEQACLPNPNPPIVQKILDGRAYRGKMFKEFDQALPVDARDKSDRAALDNAWAFWLTADSMVNMFRSYGFRRIVELRSTSPDCPLGPGLVYLPVDGAREWSRRFYVLAPDDVQLPMGHLETSLPNGALRA